MKTQTLIALGGTLLALTVAGCKSTPPRVTHFGDSSTTPKENLNATAIGGGQSGGGITGSNLPDEDRLKGRDHDHAFFNQQTVYFEYDHANVKTGEASKLDQVAAQFKTKGPDFDLLIEGHCDERGTEEYNRSLGERRALALRELLMRSGIDGSHIFTRSFGKDQPALAEHNESAWSRNRRGEFVLVLPKKFTTTQITQ